MNAQLSFFAAKPSAPGRDMRRELLTLCRTLKAFRRDADRYASRRGLSRELRAAQFALLYLRRCGG